MSITIGASYHLTATFTTSSSRSKKLVQGFNIVHLPDWGSQGPYANMATHLIDFYNNASNGLGLLMSDCVSRVSNSAELSVYAITLGSDVLGPPVYSVPFTLRAHTTTAGPLPVECSCCLSLRGNYGTDEEFGTRTRPRASDRGRTYLGPFNQEAAASDSSSPVRCVIASLVGGAIGTQVAALSSAMFSEGCALAIWSRKEGAIKPAFDWAVNNEWDTQRRRSEPAANLTWVPFGDIPT